MQRNTGNILLCKVGARKSGINMVEKTMEGTEECDKTRKTRQGVDRYNENKIQNKCHSSKYERH